ncbi:iron ABC transporter permease [uncultured Oscillibacter sp.]|uniref:FecCD family ABC transporter permease n=1 Tax=uncultured Oscillibacter sp. TaxID=876091 RepID=UPI0025E02FA7|nr:iron ABC transporter permease [uncultured Oscillibacter sp.]
MKNLRTFSIPTESVLPLLGVLAALAALLSLCLGAAPLPLGEVLAALLGRSGGPAASIVLYARLPRTCGCLLAGAALAASGTMIQGVLGNPLAAPNVIGVNAGAGLCTALCAALWPARTAAVPFAAFLGALGGVLLVLFIAERTGASKMTLVLAGVAVSGMFSAGIDAVLTFFPDALNGYTDFRVGGVANLSMSRVAPAFWVILAALALALSLAGELDVLLLGEETARSLGLPARRLRLVLLSLAAALAGAAVSFAGLLGFVGLVAPHMVRRLVGEDSSARLLAASALGGAALLTLCDILARTLFAPYELPVGVVLSLLGGPFFLWLLLRQRRRGGPGHA